MKRLSATTFKRLMMMTSRSKTMTANQTINRIHHAPKLIKLWRKLDERKRREVVKLAESARDEKEIESALRAVRTGQRELF